MKIGLIAVVMCLGITMPTMAANDMVGAEYKGNVFAIDSSTGGGTLLGPSGYVQVTGMAVHSGGKVFAATDTGTLFTVDPSTGVGSLYGAIPTGVLALAFDPNDLLYMIVNAGNNDLLASIDINTMVASKVGYTGFGNVEGLCFDSKGTLYGWDRMDPVGAIKPAGLITIDPATGIGTDVNPAVSADYFTGDIRFLASDSSGALYGGCSGLYLVDKVSGKWSLIGTGKYGDLRAGDFVSTNPCPPSWQNYGAGYPGTTGVPTLTLDAPPKIGTQPNLQAGSSALAPETSLLIFGLAQTSLPGFWGGDLLVQPLVVVVLTMPPAGYSLGLPIPNDPKLCGYKAYFQTIQSDKGAKNGAASSPGLETTIGL